MKPSVMNPAGMATQTDELAEKIKVAAQVDLAKMLRNGRGKHRRSPAKAPKENISNENGGRSKKERHHGKVLVIGSSTGGPKALAELIPNLPADLPVPVLIVQHMPPGFTKSLADRLNHSSAVKVKEAEAGDQLVAETVYLAPGDHHMLVTSTGRIALNQDPPVWGVRPSVDVTMNSVVKFYGGKTVDSQHDYRQRGHSSCAGGIPVPDKPASDSRTPR